MRNKNKSKAKTPSTGAGTPDNVSMKNNISFENERENNMIGNLHQCQDQAGARNPRKNDREVAAEKREQNIERFKQYQDRAIKKLKDRKVVILKTKPLSQLKENIERINEEFNFNFREIDSCSRNYLCKGKYEKEVAVSSQKPVSILNKTLNK